MVKDKNTGEWSKTIPWSPTKESANVASWIKLTNAQPILQAIWFGIQKRYWAIDWSYIKNVQLFTNLINYLSATGIVAMKDLDSARGNTFYIQPTIQSQEWLPLHYGYKTPQRLTSYQIWQPKLSFIQFTENSTRDPANDIVLHPDPLRS